MGKQKDRYQTWADNHMQAWAEGDVAAGMEHYAENCTYTAMNPFGDHTKFAGLEAWRRSEEGMAANWRNKKVIKNDVLSANKERGILHTWVSWTTGDGQEWACTFINIIHLDEDDKCTQYTEWNVAEQKKD